MWARRLCGGDITAKSGHIPKRGFVQRTTQLLPVNLVCRSGLIISSGQCLRHDAGLQYQC